MEGNILFSFFKTHRVGAQTKPRSWTLQRLIRGDCAWPSAIISFPTTGWPDRQRPQWSFRLAKRPRPTECAWPHPKFDRLQPANSGRCSPDQPGRSLEPSANTARAVAPWPSGLPVGPDKLSLQSRLAKRVQVQSRSGFALGDDQVGAAVSVQVAHPTAALLSVSTDATPVTELRRKPTRAVSLQQQALAGVHPGNPLHEPAK